MGEEGRGKDDIRVSTRNLGWAFLALTTGGACFGGCEAPPNGS